jgi:hypothetical protein
MRCTSFDGETGIGTCSDAQISRPIQRSRQMDI